MVDRDSRRELAIGVKKLIEGELTNDEFDDLYSLCASDDPAIKAIWSFCYCLYSSGTLIPYKLTGRHAPNPHVRMITERCIAFLQSDFEYMNTRNTFEPSGKVVLVRRIVRACIYCTVGILALTGQWQPAVFLGLAFEMIVLAAAFTRAMGRKAGEDLRLEAEERTWPFGEEKGSGVFYHR
jgi:hypothetical protein